jgi:hypothetical protein
MRCLCQRLVDLGGDLILGPGLLLHSGPKTMLQLLIFLREGYL